MEIETKTKLWISVAVLVIAFVILLIINPFFVVSAGERGVVLKWGKVDRVMSEGIHWRTPIAEHVEDLDVKIQKEQVKAESASKDLQNVSTEIALNYNLVAESVGRLWAEIGEDYKSRVIDPAIQEAVKAATAKYTAEELVTKREVVKEDIKSELVMRLAKSYILVDDLSIVNFDFSASFNQAIEAKVTAEQNALAAKNKLEQIKFEAQQTIESAKAQAQAIQIQAQAINSQGGADYVQLQAINRWNGILPAQMIPGATVPFINLTK